jgi:alpha-beta hydrolase superfamily lysophospholipase
MYHEEIHFQNDAATLAGTLYLPDSGSLHPVLTVAHAASAGTRDFGVYRHLARVLPEEGIGVFVFDRRGSGSSGGKFETASFFDLASDIQAAISRLKLRHDVDVKNLGIWGMSQGGWIAPLAASQSGDVAFIIAVSAPAVSPAEQMDYSARFELSENGFSREDIAQMLALRALGRVCKVITRE